jgi:hypothetical protein
MYQHPRRKLVVEARNIFWNAREISFDGKIISCDDYKHWDKLACEPKNCDTCCVLTPMSTGRFSDKRIFPMTDTSHMLYKEFDKFDPYNIHTKHSGATRKMPLKLLHVKSRKVVYNIVNKKYFTVSHVWSSDYFNIVNPFSKDNKGYPWLKRMAKLLNIKYAWIDTCCIDQDNVEEKKREIGNMREYYMNASSCAVLLSSTSTTDIDIFIADIQLLAHNAIDNPYRRLGHSWTLASIFYSNLLTDEWFKRIWTIQEIMLSRSVVVNSSHGLVDLTELLKCYHTLVDKLGKMIICSDEMDQTRTLSQYLHSGINSYNIGSVLELCVGRKATNEHDYVYGVLGLLPNIRIRVDYDAPLEDVTVSLFREATKNRDLSWISWIGPSFLENHKFIPVIGSSLCTDQWNSNILDKLSITFEDHMTIKSDMMDAEVIGIAQWNGAYPGITNICWVISLLCESEKICNSCFVMKFCNNGCCTPHIVRTVMTINSVDSYFCATCLASDDGERYHESLLHMEKLFAKQHDWCILLLRTQDKYLIGRIDAQLVYDDRDKQVLMFGSPETGYRGWVMDGDYRVGIVPYHEKDFVINASDIIF